jgi:hypothetical protein
MVSDILRQKLFKKMIHIILIIASLILGIYLIIKQKQVQQAESCMYYGARIFGLDNMVIVVL